jgi:hypothetical protein
MASQGAMENEYDLSTSRGLILHAYVSFFAAGMVMGIAPFVRTFAASGQEGDNGSGMGTGL